MYLKLRIDGLYPSLSKYKVISSVTKDNLKSTNNLLGRKKMCVSSFEIEAHVSRRVGFEVKEVCVLASQSRAP